MPTGAWCTICASSRATAERCRSTLRMRASSQPARALVKSTYAQPFQV